LTGTTIHPLALVEPGAQLGEGVVVGPFCHVGAEVVIGDRTQLVSHVSITGATSLGADCTVWPQAVLGAPPQNKAHKGGRTTLTIGRNCTIREGVTMHLGTDVSRGKTTVGDNGYFLAFSHVGHDCDVGNNVTLANSVALGGHVEVGDFVTIGGVSAVHQFSRIGHHAFIAGLTGVTGDVIPYALASGARSKLHGLNLIGMKRSGVARADIHAARRAYKRLFEAETPLAENLATLVAEGGHGPAVADIIAFLQHRGKRHYVSAANRGQAGDDNDADGE
jgi:UDP-N-acetylglucosamine acyltransferase